MLKPQELDPPRASLLFYLQSKQRITINSISYIYLTLFILFLIFPGCFSEKIKLQKAR